MEAFANIIIRPLRANYDISALGPTVFYFEEKKKKRIDFKVKNEFGLEMECSVFTPLNTDNNRYPCVLYCHGNSGSRVEAMDIMELLLPSDILVACFDFSGSGLSEGKYVTLGHNEKDDIKVVIKALRAMPFISDIAIWGRSMGAASALLYSQYDSHLVGLILDSPFANLNQLCQDQIKTYSIHVFALFLSNYLLDSVRNIIKKKVNFDINKVSPIDAIKNIKIPIFLFHGNQDKIVPMYHSKKLFEAAKCEKQFVEIDQDHNDARPLAIKFKAKEFLKTLFIKACQKNIAKPMKMLSLQLNPNPLNLKSLNISQDSSRSSKLSDFQNLTRADVESLNSPNQTYTMNPEYFNYDGSSDIFEDSNSSKKQYTTTDQRSQTLDKPITIDYHLNYQYQNKPQNLNGKTYDTTLMDQNQSPLTSQIQSKIANYPLIKRRPYSDMQKDFIPETFNTNSQNTEIPDSQYSPYINYSGQTHLYYAIETQSQKVLKSSPIEYQDNYNQQFASGIRFSEPWTNITSNKSNIPSYIYSSYKANVQNN